MEDSSFSMLRFCFRFSSQPKIYQTPKVTSINGRLTARYTFKAPNWKTSEEMPFVWFQ